MGLEMFNMPGVYDHPNQSNEIDVPTNRGWGRPTRGTFLATRVVGERGTASYPKRSPAVEIEVAFQIRAEIEAGRRARGVPPEGLSPAGGMAQLLRERGLR